jgi:hypothetical protein
VPTEDGGCPQLVVDQMVRVGCGQPLARLRSCLFGASGSSERRVETEPRDGHVPSVTAEDLTSHPRFGAREPPARTYVRKLRHADTAAVIEEPTGYSQPARAHNPIGPHADPRRAVNARVSQHAP